MEIVCQTIESESPQDNRAGQFRYRPEYFLIYLQFDHSVEVSGDSNKSAGNMEELYSVTIKLAPEEHSLCMFVRQRDKERFLSKPQPGLKLLNRESKTLCDYWGYESHESREYSVDDIKFIDHPLTTLDCASGPANAMFLLDTCRVMLGECQGFPTLEPSNVHEGLYDLLSLVCGNERADLFW
jgi:hypothetical protein